MRPSGEVALVGKPVRPAKFKGLLSCCNGTSECLSALRPKVAKVGASDDSSCDRAANVQNGLDDRECDRVGAPVEGKAEGNFRCRPESVAPGSGEGCEAHDGELCTGYGVDFSPIGAPGCGGHLCHRVTLFEGGGQELGRVTWFGVLCGTFTFFVDWRAVSGWPVLPPSQRKSTWVL